MGNKRTCGITVPTSCVPWTGGLLLSFDVTPICDPSAEEVIIELDKVLAQLKDTLDVTQINGICHALPTSKKWYDIASFLYNEVCSLSGRINALQPQNIVIGNMPVAVNLECMTGACATTPLKLSQLFELIIHKLCVIEGRLNVIDPSNNSSGDTLFQPS